MKMNKLFYNSESLQNYFCSRARVQRLELKYTKNCLIVFLFSFGTKMYDVNGNSAAPISWIRGRRRASWIS